MTMVGVVGYHRQIVQISAGSANRGEVWRCTDRKRHLSISTSNHSRYTELPFFGCISAFEVVYSGSFHFTNDLFTPPCVKYHFYYFHRSLSIFCYAWTEYRKWKCGPLNVFLLNLEASKHRSYSPIQVFSSLLQDTYEIYGVLLLYTELCDHNNFQSIFGHHQRLQSCWSFLGLPNQNFYFRI